MKKYIKHIVLSFASIALLLSCNKDEDKATGYVATSPNIISPSNGTTYTLNPNAPGDVAMNFQWTAANFGYDSSTSYALQILKASQSFGTDTPQSISLGTFGEYSNQTYTYSISTTALNAKLRAANSATVGVTETFKMRVFAYPAGQSTATGANAIKAYSQEITFTSNIYDPIDEAAKLYVMGNFGAASTFADWDINTTGTSNSPIIYSALNNNIYEGFVYMNVASPQFKLANPTTTDLNIKGVGSAYTGTSLLNVSDPSNPFGDTSGATGLAAPGTLASTTDVSTGNVIIPPAASASSYFIKAKWDTNQYIVVKRKMSITGSATGYVPKVLTYDTNPASPFYRMYVGTNLSLVGGFFYIQVKDNSSATASKLERFGLDNTQTSSLQLTTSSSAPAKNVLKFGGTNVDIVTPGSYTIALDLRNSARYNFIAIKN